MLPKLLELCYDAVPNVRLCLANLCVHCMTGSHTPHTDVVSAVGDSGGAVFGNGLCLGQVVSGNGCIRFKIDLHVLHH